MNSPIPASALEAQVDAMLQRVARDRDQRCAQMRAAAESQARELLRSGRAEARAHMRKAVTQERARFIQGLRQAEARAELEARWQAQRQTLQILELMWQEIPGVLEARWRVPEHRQSWIEAAIRQAGMLLNARAWRIEHGGDWPDVERRRLEQLAAAHGVSAIEWSREADALAGLRIRSEGVCLDATIRGLLVRRDDIESLFLAEYFALAGEAPAHG